MKLSRSFARGLSLVLALMMGISLLSGCSSQEQTESGAAQESSQAADSAAQTSDAAAAADSTVDSTADAAADSAAAPSYEPFDFSQGIDENGFMSGITASDYVELPQYEGIQVPADIAAVTDAEIQAEIDKILSSYATTSQVKDRAVADGDSVNIDYVGSVDGVPFDGGSTQGQGTTVTLGVTNYIPGFLEQLIGHKPGENFDINVTFPETYHAEELAGKDAVFNITINYIDVTTLPELTDDFVANFLKEEAYNISTVEELKAYVTEQLQEPKVRDYVFNYLMENTAFKAAPGSLMTYMEGVMTDYYSYYAYSYGLDLESFLQQYVGVESLDALKEQSKESLQKDVNSSLLLQAIAEQAGITVTEEDLRMYFEDLTGNADYSSYQEEYGLPYLMQAVLFTKVQDYVFEKAVIE